MRLYRPIQTRFRFGFPSLVNLATYRNSQAHSSKGTPSWPPYGDDTLTVCKPTVSGTISLPSRGAFHLSLTVLVHYRSPQIHADFHGLGVTWDDMRRLRAFRIRGYYPLRPAFPEPFFYTAAC